MTASANAVDRATIFRTLFHDSQDGMYASTAGGRFVEVNRSLCTLLGYRREALLALPVERIYELPGERRRFIYEIEANGGVRGFHVRLKDSAGAIHPCTVDAVVWRTGVRDVDGYVGVIRNRPHGPASALFLDAEHFSLAARGSSDGLWEWDIRHKKARFSSRWKALLGYGNSDVGDSMDEWTTRIHARDMARFRETLARYLRRESPVFSCYHRLRHRNGQYLWMMARGVAEYLDTGAVARIAGSLTDVSGHMSTIEQLQAEETRLSTRNDQLERERELLARYFPEEVVERIRSNTDTTVAGGLSRAAVIYLKIKDSAGILASLDAQRFAHLLNDFTTDILDLVHSHRGSVNRVLGDSILITWGCPLAAPGDLGDCLRCALDIREYLKVFNDVRPEGVVEAVGVGMGLSYGTVFAGTLGSVRRMEYTILGAPVGSAQTLMQRAVETEHDILVGPEVVACANGSLEVKETTLPGAYSLVSVK
jgi:PAS domain S-box-containing protein